MKKSEYTADAIVSITEDIKDKVLIKKIKLTKLKLNFTSYISIPTQPISKIIENIITENE